MKRFTVWLVVPIMLLVSGCSQTPAQVASGVQNVIGAVLQIAQAEEPVLPPADSAILTPWVSLGMTLDSQLKACISSAGNGKAATFAACFTAFSSGLLSTTELNQLRVLSAASQGKVQLWVTALVVGINTALVIYKAGSLAVPSVGAAPSAAQWTAFRSQLGY